MDTEPTVQEVYIMEGAVKKFATVNPESLSSKEPHTMQNLVDGKWVSTQAYRDVVDPLHGGVFIRCPDPSEAELEPFKVSLAKVTKSGRHNPLKNPERYLMYGNVCHRAARMLYDPDVLRFFVRCIQRVMPKSEKQALGEMIVIRMFLENFSGDSVRTLCRGFFQAGDHFGQMSSGYRWPYGPVAIVAPFNFPLEIPILQVLGAAMVGNKPVLKPESRVGMPVEQFIRMLIMCGLPADEIDLLNCPGAKVEKFLTESNVRLVQFTGGSEVAEKLCISMKGRVKLEDAGFDWKILGPRVTNMDYVAYQCDQDAFAISGQKCSAQSMLLAHEDWLKAGLIDKLSELAKKRNISDLTVSPVLSHSNEQIHAHVTELSKIPGARILFGGCAIEGTQVPKQYGMFSPTAVFVPFEQILHNGQPTAHFKLVTTELFGPVEVITEWGDGQIDDVLRLLELMEHHLTAAVVSNDPIFVNYVLANTVNGTTYAGIRARTTGAPQNHWFGPAGNPLGAGIGTAEAILSVYTCHREIISDVGPIPSDWKCPPPS